MSEPRGTVQPSVRDASAHVTTFYSFKGGVGRSLLLANVGWLLAERRRVLLWDLDVEAPGLHRIPALRPPSVPRGFFEWLESWKGEMAFQERQALSTRDAKELRRLVLPVPGRPQLSILPAFGDGADFGRLYAEGPWRRLLVDQPDLGLALFHAVLAGLSAERDHVLIDSRTGITDVGGLLAALLPHATVLVGGYGHQSLAGLLHVKKALEPAAEGKLEPRQRLGDAGAALSLVHVVSPVPEETTEATERRRVWREVFGDAVDAIEVPFDKRLLWSERLLAADDSTSPPARAYATVAERIDGLRLALLARQESTAAVATRYPEGKTEREADPRAKKGYTFEQRVGRLLELHGYVVEPEQIIAGNRVDLVARLSVGLEQQCWWVECKDHTAPVGKAVLETLASWVAGREARQQNARAMVVARRFSPAALAYAADHHELAALTVDELERRLFDARPYLHALVTGFEKSPLARTYVRQRVLLETRGDGGNREPDDLLDHALAWATGGGPRLWLLLGDYGTGKSVFFRRFAYELARRALDDPEAPFPVAVDLKEYPNATTAETLLFEHLRRAVPGFRGDPAALLHLLSAGRCVLLLDAFDEMGIAAAGRSVEEQFRELARLAGDDPLEPGRGGRVLVTCRTHFFRDQQQVKDTATGRVRGIAAPEDSTLGRLARRFNAEIDELCLFDDKQISEFLRLHLGVDADKARQFIRDTYDLGALAPQPVLLEMIVRSLPELWREGPAVVNPAGLYEVYTRHWLEDRSGRSLQTRPELRHRLLTLLAVTLWGRDDRQLHHRELLAEVERLGAHFPGLDHDRVDVELRSAAFLVRSAEGYYRFSHKSFLEYFLARRLADALAEMEPDGAADALDLPPLSPEVGDFLWQLVGEDRAGRLAVLRGLLGSPYRPRVSENALRLGAISQRHGAIAFAVKDARLTGAELANVTLDGVALPNADLQGADLQGASLADADLRRARLGGARLDRATLRGANLAGALLDAARLDRAIVRNADMTGASLQGASLAAADLTAAILRGARLDGAFLNDAAVDRADLSGATLVGADLTAAWGDRTTLEDADLTGARLLASVWTRAKSTHSRLEGADTDGWLQLASEGALGTQPAAPLRGACRPVLASAHRGAVWSVAFSADGRWLASGGDDGTVRLWDPKSGEARRLFHGHKERVWSVAFAADGGLLASGGLDGSVRLWDAKSGEAYSLLQGHKASVSSVAFAIEGGLLVSGGSEGTVRLWDAKSGKARGVLRGHEGGVRSVAFAADGALLASGGDDETVRLWDPRSREARGALRGHKGSVRSVAFAADGALLASGGDDGTVRLWDPRSREARGVLRGHKGSVRSVAFAVDGGMLGSGGDDGTVRIWDAKSGEARGLLRGHEASVLSVAFVGNPASLASVDDSGTVRLWDGTSGRSRAVHVAFRGSVTVSSVTVAAEGRLLASGSQDGTVRIWDLNNCEGRGPLRGHTEFVRAVAFAPGSGLLASGSDDGTVRLWDPHSAESRGVLRGHEPGGVNAVAFAPSGESLASAGDDWKVRLWDLRSCKERRALNGHEARVWSVAFAPDGASLASGGEDGTVWLWDIESGEARRLLHGPEPKQFFLSVAFAPDGTLLAAGSDNGNICLWDPISGTLRGVLRGHEGRVWSVVFAGESLASASADNTVRLWEPISGRTCRVFRGHDARVWSVTSLPTGGLLASGGDDGVVRIWDLHSGEARGWLAARSELSLASTPQGWFWTNRPPEDLDPRAVRLDVETGRGNGWCSSQFLPLGGLLHLLRDQSHVEAALAGSPAPAPLDLVTLFSSPGHHG